MSALRNVCTTHIIFSVILWQFALSSLCILLIGMQINRHSFEHKILVSDLRKETSMTGQ